MSTHPLPEKARPDHEILVAKGFIFSVLEAFSEPTVFVAGESLLRHSREQLCDLEGLMEKFGLSGLHRFEGIRPVDNFSLGMLCGKVSALDTVLQHAGDAAPVAILRNTARWKVWYIRQFGQGGEWIEKDARAEVIRNVGEVDLGPWTDFGQGRVCGFLSAFNWALGDSWNSLDT